MVDEEDEEVKELTEEEKKEKEAEIEELLKAEGKSPEEGKLGIVDSLKKIRDDFKEIKEGKKNGTLTSEDAAKKYKEMMSDPNLNSKVKEYVNKGVEKLIGSKNAGILARGGELEKDEKANFKFKQSLDEAIQALIENMAKLLNTLLRIAAYMEAKVQPVITHSPSKSNNIKSEPETASLKAGSGGAPSESASLLQKLESVENEVENGHNELNDEMGIDPEHDPAALEGGAALTMKLESEKESKPSLQDELAAKKEQGQENQAQEQKENTASAEARRPSVGRPK